MLGSGRGNWKSATYGSNSLVAYSTHVGCGAGEKMEITSKSYLLLLKGSSIRKPLIFCKGLKLKVPEPLSIDYTILGQAPESINIDIY